MAVCFRLILAGSTVYSQIAAAEPRVWAAINNTDFVEELLLEFRRQQAREN